MPKGLYPYLVLWGAMFGWSCDTAEREQNEAPPPNIIWLVAEDQSPDFFPMYGDSTIRLPAIESLAANGLVFTRAYSPVPVCAPARSAIITGMYPTTLGTHNMRTYNAYSLENQPEIGIPSYSPIPPPGVKMFTGYLRAAGYYCTNNAKEDYNFRPTDGAWDESSNKAHWRNRANRQPFFAVFNFSVCHESQVWQRGQDSLWVSPANVPVPPYFPDNDTIRHDLAVNYSNLGRLDLQVGDILRQLREDGLYDNSYIFFYGDHGGPFPRHKRALYESGLRVPMLIKLPGNERAGQMDNRFLSFIDLAPTVLSIAGVEPPKVMQGTAQLGRFKDSTIIGHVYASSDRFDEVYDRLRAIRSERFKYIRNFNPGISNALPVSYREQMPMMRSLRQRWDDGELDKQAALWFRTPKPTEELYDLYNDPHELQNLALRAEYQDTLLLLRKLLDNWMRETRDLGRYPEKELIDHWLIEGDAPAIPPIEAVEKDGHFLLRSTMNDATLVWKNQDSIRWNIYTEPIPNTRSFEAKAVRIGYADSEILSYEPD